MNTKHTPGPWHVANGPIVYAPDGFAIANAVVFHGRHEPEASQANAHLIAAAPRLFEILSHILAAHESGNNGAVMGEAVLCEQFATLAREAINQAKGEA